MKDILVINLMRLGDLIQSTPLLRAVRRAHPAARMTLLVQDVFQEIAALMPYYDRLFILDFLKLAPLMDREAAHLPYAFTYLNEVKEQLRNPPPDVVINLTPTRLGAILSRIAGGKEVRGLTLTPARTFVSQPDWMSYLLCAANHRRFNPFNVVDQFTRGAGYQPQSEGVTLRIPAAVQQQVDQELAAAGLTPQVCLIGLQPGASASIRQWPPGNFAEVARLLLSTHPCHFLLLGTEKERPLGEAIQAQLPAGSVTSLMGKTRLATLTAYLARMRLLITNDTGTMHIACGVGTPVLALFLATARVYDTGPTGRGHIALQPRLDCYPCRSSVNCAAPRCHQALSPAAVASLALSRLTDAPLTSLPDDPQWQTLEVFVSDYDEQGFQQYLPLICRPLERSHFWNAVMRVGWRWLLDGNQETLNGQIKSAVEFLRRNFLPPANDLGEEHGTMILLELIDLARQGVHLTRQILPLTRDAEPHQARIRQLGDRLALIDASLTRLAVIFPEVASLIEMFCLSQKQLTDNNLRSLTCQTRTLYSQLLRRGKIFLRILALLSASLPETESLGRHKKAFFPVDGRLRGTPVPERDLEMPTIYNCWRTANP